jgi:hypothetical protein
MPDEGGGYKSIEEVRSILYPRSAAILNLEKEDVLEFPANLTDEPREAVETTGGRSGSGALLPQGALCITLRVSPAGRSEMSRASRKGEKNTRKPAAHAPANAISIAGRMPMVEPRIPPRRPPNGNVPQVIQRLAAFIRPRSSGGQTDCR